MLRNVIVSLCLVFWLGDIVSDLCDGISALDDYSPVVELAGKSGRDGSRFSSRTSDNLRSILGSLSLSDSFRFHRPLDPMAHFHWQGIESDRYAGGIFSLKQVLLI